jgi:hypothetical protein
MEHSTDDNIERLDPPLGPDDEVSAYIAVSAQNRKSHEFAVLVCSTPRRGIKPISSYSAEHGTTVTRALLEALLATYEWLKVNAANAKRRRVYSSSEYLSRYAQNEARRPPRELLKKNNADLLLRLNAEMEALPDVEILPPVSEADQALAEGAEKALIVMRKLRAQDAAHQRRPLSRG